MNILFVIDFFKPHIGGVEKLFGLLSEKMANDDNNVTCITWKYERHLAKKENIQGLKVFRITSPSRLFFSLAALPKIIKEARKADLIHTSTYSSALGAWIAGKITKKKVLITVHEVWGNLWMELPFLSWVEKKIFRLSEKWLFKLKFEKYIAVSDYTAKSLVEIGVPAHKITRIYNGIDYNLPHWEEPHLPYTFTFYGRAGASKGLDILLEATEKFSIFHPDIHFSFILSPQSKKIFNIVSSRIEYGPLKKSSKIFSNLPYHLLVEELLKSNCIIIPSYCEGFGFTATEASAMKIPIISSGMGSLPEVTSGRVVTMTDYSSESLLKAMEDALNNQFEIFSLKKFSIEEFISNHFSLYDQVIRK